MSSSTTKLLLVVLTTTKRNETGNAHSLSILPFGMHVEKSTASQPASRETDCRGTLSVFSSRHIQMKSVLRVGVGWLRQPTGLKPSSCFGLQLASAVRFTSRFPSRGKQHLINLMALANWIPKQLDGFRPVGCRSTAGTQNLSLMPTSRDRRAQFISVLVKPPPRKSQFRREPPARTAGEPQPNRAQPQPRRQPNRDPNRKPNRKPNRGPNRAHANRHARGFGVDCAQLRAVGVRFAPTSAL